MTDEAGIKKRNVQKITLTVLHNIMNEWMNEWN